MIQKISKFFKEKINKEHKNIKRRKSLEKVYGRTK
jgi:hypothetical protein